MLLQPHTYRHTHALTPVISWSTVFSLWTNIQPWAIIKYYSLLCSSLLLPPYHNSAQPLILFSCFLPLFLLFPLPVCVCMEGGYHLCFLSNKLKWLLFGFGWSFFFPHATTFTFEAEINKQTSMLLSQLLGWVIPISKTFFFFFFKDGSREILKVTHDDKFIV